MRLAVADLSHLSREELNDSLWWVRVKSFQMETTSGVKCREESAFRHTPPSLSNSGSDASTRVARDGILVCLQSAVRPV